MYISIICVGAAFQGDVRWNMRHVPITRESGGFPSSTQEIKIDQTSAV